MRASETVGRVLSPGDVVVYELTVYPGATEEVCMPILAKASASRSTATSSLATRRSASIPVICSTGSLPCDRSE